MELFILQVFLNPSSPSHENGQGQLGQKRESFKHPGWGWLGLKIHYMNKKHPQIKFLTAFGHRRLNPILVLHPSGGGVKKMTGRYPVKEVLAVKRSSDGTNSYGGTQVPIKKDHLNHRFWVKCGVLIAPPLLCDLFEAI